MVPSNDTTPDAFARQLDGFRLMSPLERLRLSLAMSDDVRQVAEAGIRARHPEYADPQVREELEALVLGRVLAAAVRRARLAPGP